jgi:hypothetical protein
MRISKAGVFAKTFPKPVADVIRKVAASYDIKSLSFSEVEADKIFSIGEGDKYIGIYPNGKVASFEAVAQHNVGASNVTHRIGQRFGMPSNTYLVCVHYYGGFMIHVSYVKPRDYSIPKVETKMISA